MTDFVDPYLDPSTGILRNLVGARKRADLDQAEADLVTARSVDLVSAQIKPTRDLTELRAIHGYLFQDVYGWAGHLRSVDIRKNTDGGEFFVPASLIERASGFAFGELAGDGHLQGMDRPRFIERIAYHYDQLNHIHPFREGNGRAQRAFWDRVAFDAGHRLDWTAATGPVNDAASQLAAAARDLSLLTAMFDQVVAP